MASLNSVTIELQVQNEKEATAALKRFSAESERLSTSVLDSANKLKSITSRWDQANQMVKDGTLTTKGYAAAQTQLARELAVLNGMYKTVTRGKKEYQRLDTLGALQQLKLAEDTRKATEAKLRDAEAMRRIRMTYQKGYASFVQARQAMRDLKRAFDSGAISADEYRAQIARIRQEHELMRDGGRRVRRSMNDTGLAIQQVGYQVSDFAVQVQSGANPFVALGQQGAQLAGILPLVHKRLGLTMKGAIGLSAGLGIAIPLITAFAATLFTTSRNSGEAANGIETLEDRMESARQETRRYRQELEQLNRGFEDAADMAFADQITAAQGELAAARVALATAQFIANQDGPLELAGADEIAAAAAAASIPALENRVRLAEAELQAHIAVREQLEAQNRMREASEAWAEGQARASEERLEALLEAGRVAEEGRLAREDMRRELEAETALYQAILMYGEESAQVEALRAEQARAAHEARVLETTTNEVLIAQAMEYYDAMVSAREQSEQMVNLTENLTGIAQTLVDFYQEYRDATMEAADALKDDAAEAADDLADKIREAADAAADAAREAADLKREAIEAKNAAEAIAKADMATGIGEAGIAAATLATNLGIALGHARAIAAIGAAETASGVASGSIPPWAMDDLPEAPMSAADQAWQDYLERQRSAFREANSPDSSSGGGGGGGGSSRTAEEYIAQLEREAEQRERLIGLSEEQRIREERRVDILSQVEELQGTVSQARIEQLLDEEERIRELEQAEARRQDLMQVVQGSLESGLMALVDGSQSVEEAFRNMLRSILAEIARQAIVDPIASGITSMLFSANGNAFSGGRLMPFANGGVVGGPTMFPMAGGRTGLMGEAGPEAIMPLKRTRGGKLGVAVEGGGSVINLTYNFQGGVTQADLGRALPLLVEKTKRSVVDTVQRGGSVGRVFR